MTCCSTRSNFVVSTDYNRQLYLLLRLMLQCGEIYLFLQRRSCVGGSITCEGQYGVYSKEQSQRNGRQQELGRQIFFLNKIITTNQTKKYII